MSSDPVIRVVGQFHVNSSGLASWIDHTLNVNFKLTHYRIVWHMVSCYAVVQHRGRSTPHHGASSLVAYGRVLCVSRDIPQRRCYYAVRRQ
jgi:hypothetical protein